MGFFITLIILAGVQAYIGIEMANTPPTKKWHRWFWRIAFFVNLLSMLIVGCFQFIENEAQQKNLTDRLKAVQLQLEVVQLQLTNSLSENLKQFQELSEEFSTNSSIAIAIRVGILTNALDHAIAEGDELQKSHELFDVSSVDINAVRAERDRELAIQENQAKQEKLQQELNNIQAQQDAAKQAVEDAEQKREAEKELFDKEKMLSSPALPVFDYTIRKLYEILDGVSKGSGWTISSDFPGQIPTLYASALASNGIVTNGTNYLTLGTNSAWNFEISAHVPPLPLRDFRQYYRGREYAVLTVQAVTTNGDSILTVTSQYEHRGDSKFTYEDFWLNHIKGDYWFNNVQISLTIPNGLNMDEGSTYTDYTNDIDTALTRLVGAQDQQCKVPSH